VKLARIVEDVALEKNAIIATQPADIYRVSQIVSIPVLLSMLIRLDTKYTGHIITESLKASGASGSMLNHSEKPIELEKLKDVVAMSKKAGLDTVVCVSDDKTAMSAAAFGPDMISTEPPEPISTGVAASVVKLEMISNTVRIVRQMGIHILCGAGIRRSDDVKEAVRLGAKGIVILSGIVLSDNPRKKLLELAEAFMP